MMERPLSGLSVWVTRPEPENQRSAEFWRAAGAAVALVPFLMVVQEEVSPEQIDLLASDPPDHVVFTSARAVDKLLAVLRHRPELIARLKGRPTWTVGERTLQAARDAGFQELKANPGHSARELAEHMVANLKTADCVFFAAAKQRRPDLVRILSTAGIRLVEWTVYDSVRMSITVPEHRLQLHADPPPLLLLYSPTAVHAAAHILGSARSTTVPVATLGASTRAAAEEWNLRIAASAHPASEDSLLADVAQWWSDQRGGEV